MSYDSHSMDILSEFNFILLWAPIESYTAYR